MVTIFNNIIQQEHLRGLWKGMTPVSICTVIIVNDFHNKGGLFSSVIKFNVRFFLYNCIYGLNHTLVHRLNK